MSMNYSVDDKEEEMNSIELMNLSFACPITKSKLRHTDRETLLKLVEDPSVVSPAITSAYISDEAGLAFPVEGQIFNFLITGALKISLSDREPRVVSETTSGESVRKWYDEFGWKKAKGECYNDSAIFSSSEMNAAKRYEVSSHLSLVDRLGSGSLILNAASGAMPHQYQFSYFFHFRNHVCLDFSKTALIEAKERLGNQGFCVLADICNMPFVDNCFDGIITAYTIQHIDKENQKNALEELYRVLNCRGVLLIVNNNNLYKKNKIRKLVIRILRVFSRLYKVEDLGNRNLGDSKPVCPVQPSVLYSHNAAISWWKNAAHDLGAKANIESFQLLDSGEVASFFDQKPNFVRMLRRVESVFASPLRCISAYILIEIKKIKK